MNSTRVEGPASRAAHVRTGVMVQYLSIGWTLLEAVVGLSAGLFTGSIALVGFGLDSVIEIVSSGFLLWRLKADQHEELRERKESQALRGVAWCFFALAAYVMFEAVKSLIRHELPEKSVIGLCLATACVVVMPILARAKRRTSLQIGSRALAADSRQSDICAYLSVILLIGLALNALFGWWWADPVAAVLMVPIIIREGYQALCGKACCESCSCHP